jgi:hypothetical protein
METENKTREQSLVELDESNFVIPYVWFTEVTQRGKANLPAIWNLTSMVHKSKSPMLRNLLQGDYIVVPYHWYFNLMGIDNEEPGFLSLVFLRECMWHTRVEYADLTERFNLRKKDTVEALHYLRDGMGC